MLPIVIESVTRLEIFQGNLNLPILFCRNDSVFVDHKDNVVSTEFVRTIYFETLNEIYCVGVE